MLDEFKTKLSINAEKISELEVEARKKLQAHDYHTAAKRIAGALTIIAKRSEQFADPESTSENIAYAAVVKATGLYQKEHLKGLAFVTQNATDNEGGDPREGELWSDFQRIHAFNYDSNVKPNMKLADGDIVAHVGKELARIMPALTTKFWEDHKRIKREAALDAELDEFLGIEEIDHANQGLSEAMEIGDDNPMKSYIETTVNDRLKRINSKEKAKQRKNSSADTANQGSLPKKSGRDGKAKGKKKNEKERGRLKKKSPERYDDKTSYES